ncbi:MAG: SurA N-terminal domain-containing protein [Paracoccaceae bacterium]
MARKKGQISKFLVGIMLVMLMVGLAGFGVTNFGGRIRTIGEVGTVEISVDQYARALDEELRNLQQRFGQQFSLEQARQFGVDAQVIQRLISQAALENETNRIGLSVGDAEVQRQLLSTQGFRGISGDFDRDAYEFTLERNNLTAQEYEASIRNRTAGTILQSAVISGITASGTYSDVILGFLGELRSFSWLELDAKSLNSPLPTPTEADLQAHFDSHGDDYTVPASKSITYVWLSPESVIDQINIDEAALQAIYDSRSAEYNTPERRIIERLIFSSMANAEAAATRISTAETSFDAVVGERGLNLADIDLGDVTRASLGAAGDAVFSLTEPGISAPVDTDLGPAIFRVNAILAAQSIPFEHARAALLEEEAADNARRLVSDQIAEFDDLLAGGATLEELANETDMVLGTIDWSAVNTDGIAAYSGFSITANAVTNADFPSIEILEDGGIFALRLDAEIAAHPDSYENVRDQVATDQAADALTQALEADSAVLLASLSGGATLSSLGHPTTVETHIKRDGVFLGKPETFLSSVFKLEQGAATSVTGAGRVFIMQLNVIADADPNDSDLVDLGTAIDTETGQTIGQDALELFVRALQNKAGISLNQTAINAVHARFPGTGGSAIPAQMQGGSGGDHN